MVNAVALSLTEDLTKIVVKTIDSITDYLKDCEEQKTERVRICACLDAITKKMDTDRIKFDSYMKASFAERESLYSKVEQLLNKSIEDGNTEMCKMALNFIVTVYNKNPIEGLNETLGSPQLDLLSGGIKNYLD